MTRDFITGVILGVVIALMWRNLQRPQPTPPDRNSKILSPIFGEQKVAS